MAHSVCGNCVRKSRSLATWVYHSNSAVAMSAFKHLSCAFGNPERFTPPQNRVRCMLTPVQEPLGAQALLTTA